MFSEKCSTCIFWPGNRMHLREGYLQDIIRENVERGALLTCHQTLPYGDALDEPTACHGFWSGYGLKTTAGIIARFAIGIIFVNPPKKEYSEQVQAGRQAEPAGNRHEQEADQAGAEDGPGDR